MRLSPFWNWIGLRAIAFPLANHKPAHSKVFVYEPFENITMKEPLSMHTVLADLVQRTRSKVGFVAVQRRYRGNQVCLYLSRSNRARLEAIINDRNRKAKTIWRAKIVLATADGHGTNEIMRRTGMSKSAVWRWQERYIEEGIEGLLRDKTRPSRIPPLSDAVKLAVLTKPATEEPPDPTHASRASMAEAVGVS